MDDQQAIINNLLFRAWPGLGPKKQQQLRDRLGTAEAVFCYLENSQDSDDLAMLAQQVKQWRKPDNPMRQWAEQEMKRCQALGITLLSIDCQNYPALLKEISTPPPVLYLQGNTHLLQQRQLAMVGARKASQQGLRFSRRWAYELSQAGLVITSGMAEGVDAAAHEGALAAGKPTIAVLAHGLDVTYPKKHQALKQQIIEQGLIVSEFALETQPKRNHFPQRNRIISGLSEAVLLVEAAIKSGSLITARFAIEQNRELFAIPWALADTQSAGGNHLIQQGAHLADSSEYILQALGWQAQKAIAESKQNLADEVLKIPAHFTSMDELAVLLDLPIGMLSQQLLQWEVQGLLEAKAGCYRRLVG